MAHSSQFSARWFVWLVAGVTLLLPTYLIRWSAFGIPSTVWEVVLYAVTLIGLGVGCLRFSFFWNNPIRWPLAFLTVAAGLAVIVSPDFRVALGQWKALFVDSLLFYWLIGSAVRTGKDLTCVQSGYLAGAGFVALQALIVGALGEVTSDGRVIGIYAADEGASPNYLALFLAPAAAISLVRAALPGVSWAQRALSGMTGGVIMAAVVMSASRAGVGAVLVATLIGFMVLASQRYHQSRRMIWLGGISLLIAGALVVFPSFLPNFTPSPGDVTARIASSNNIRWEIWRTTVTTLVPGMSIFGLGWGNYQPVFTEATKTWVNYPEYVAPLALHPHNFFLTTLVTLGYLGVIAWVWILVQAVQNILRRPGYSVPALAGLVAWFIQGLPDTTYYKNDLAPLTWLLLLPFLLQILSSDVLPGSREKPNTLTRKSSISHSRR